MPFAAPQFSFNLLKALDNEWPRTGLVHWLPLPSRLVNGNLLMLGRSCCQTRSPMRPRAPASSCSKTLELRRCQWALGGRRLLQKTAWSDATACWWVPMASPAGAIVQCHDSMSRTPGMPFWSVYSVLFLMTALAWSRCTMRQERTPLEVCNRLCGPLQANPMAQRARH